MKNHLLAIGIDKYLNCNNLNNACKDVNNLIDVLTNKYNFTSDNITSLLNEDATRENIYNALEILLQNQTKDDNLIIYYGGHGEYDELLDIGYLLTHEAKVFDKSSYLEYSSIYNYLKVIKSRHIVLISDSCFSGTFFQYRKPSVSTGKERLYQIPSRWALTSGRIEPVSDGEPGKNSPFASSLIENLKNNKSELFGISELSNLVTNDVANLLIQIPRGEQLPIPGNKGGEFLFQLKVNPSSNKVKIAKEVRSESNELSELLQEIRRIETEIEEAVNKSLSGTENRLLKEKNILLELFHNVVEQEFSIQNSKYEINVEDEFGINVKEILIKIEKNKIEKNNAVKNQQYTQAAEIRDMEYALMLHLTNQIGNISLPNIIKITPSSVIKNFNKLEFINQYTLKYVSSVGFKKFENFCKEIYKLNVLFENKLISKYELKLKFDSLISEIENLLIKMDNEKDNRNIDWAIVNKLLKTLEE